MDNALWSFLPLLLGIGGFLTPIVMAARNRDRFFQTEISDVRSFAVTAVAQGKEDVRKMIDAAVGPIHDRISRVRDEYVRRDDLDGHLKRIEKRFDDVAAQMVRNAESTDKKLDEIYRLLQGRTHNP